VTGTGASLFGFASLWPTGAAQPSASNINWSAAGQTIANAVIVPLGTGGSVNVLSGNAGTDMVVDINGYFSSVLGSPNNNFQLTTNSALYTMFLQNLATGCTGTCGTLQTVASGTAIEGDAMAVNGSGVFGVYGFNASSGSDGAGVAGVAVASSGANGGFVRTGVRGESSTGNGVLGLTANAAGGSFGVAGFSIDNTGATVNGGRLGYNGVGVSFTGGLSGSGTKAFLEPHPTDPSKMIRYISLEGPEAGTYFRGTARTVNGRAVIEVPETFRIVTDPEGLTVQLTAMGSKFVQLAVESKDLDRIVVLSTRDVSFDYLAHGVRRAYKNVDVLTENTHFAPLSAADRMPVSLSAEERQRLIDNGTYNPDGSVNMKTAEAVGWTKGWAEREEQSRKAAEAAANAKKAQLPH
jgi:hypothetical protein